MASDAPEPFVCRNCGQCCKGYGGTFVTEKDIRSIADFLGVDPERFVEIYCRESGGKPILAQRSDGYCIFWDANCTIHPVKPRMCRAWPFIESVLRDFSNWSIMAASCPGIRLDFPETIIRDRVRKALNAHPQPRIRGPVLPRAADR